MGRAIIINRHHAIAGFSLIEILAALAILSLIASVVMMNTPPSRSAAQRSASMFAMELQQAINHASISATPLQLVFADGGYTFAEYKDREWVDLNPQKRAQPNAEVPVRMDRSETVSVMANARFVSGDDESTEKDKIIAIDPIGGIEPFTARFGVRAPVAVILDSTGSIRVIDQ